MTFVNEKYPESERQKIAALVKSRPPLTQPTESSWWTVDYSRNVFLVIVGAEGGAYEGTPETRHYVLMYDGAKIEFSGECRVTGSIREKEGQVMHWNIRNVSIPEAFRLSRMKVLDLISEALDAQGLRWNRDCLTAVHVNFRGKRVGVN